MRQCAMFISQTFQYVAIPFEKYGLCVTLNIILFSEIIKLTTTVLVTRDCNFEVFFCTCYNCLIKFDLLISILSHLANHYRNTLNFLADSCFLKPNTMLQDADSFLNS